MGDGGDGCGVRWVGQQNGNRSLHLIGYLCIVFGTEQQQLRAGGLSRCHQT
jgi:hypothetical protein